MGGRSEGARRPSIRVVIFTEAGPKWGHGHLMRCSALRDGFEALGISADLVVRGVSPTGLASCAGGTNGEWASAVAAADLLEGADAAVVDSYHAGLETYESIAGAVSVSAYLDDQARLAYPPGLVINSSPAASSLHYRGPGPHTLLLGPRYHAMRRAFWSPRERPVVAREMKTALVVFGGTDASGLRSTLLPKVIGLRDDLEWDVVDALRNAEEMRDAMLAADVAVSAAGQTLYELARTGTPTVAIAVAGNQAPQARAFRDAGAATLASADDPNSVLEALSALNSSQARARMSSAASALVDGQGSLRVARAVAARVLRDRVRLAVALPEDERAVFRLANDPMVRANSGEVGLIAEEEHHEWYQRRMADKSSPVLLAWDGGFLAGQVRFDVTHSAATIGISIAEGYRGLGWSPLLLQQAVEVFQHSEPSVTTLVAAVRVENIASRRLFEGAGFVCDNPHADASQDFARYERALSGS